MYFNCRRALKVFTQEFIDFSLNTRLKNLNSSDERISAGGP